MTATNHAITGAIVGLAISNPVLALPLAFASHFLIDMLPHFGFEGNRGFGEALKHRRSRAIPIIEPILLLFIVLLLAYYSASIWVYCAAFLAVSPDFVGVYNYLAYEKKSKAQNKFLYFFHIRFHRPIQRFERPWGIYIEAIYFIVALVLMINLLK
jgi:hypothetical protein